MLSPTVRLFRHKPFVAHVISAAIFITLLLLSSSNNMMEIIVGNRQIFSAYPKKSLHEGLGVTSVERRFSREWPEDTSGDIKSRVSSRRAKQNRQFEKQFEDLVELERKARRNPSNKRHRERLLAAIYKLALGALEAGARRALLLFLLQKTTGRIDAARLIDLSLKAVSPGLDRHKRSVERQALLCAAVRGVPSKDFRPFVRKRGGVTVCAKLHSKLKKKP